VLDGIKTTGLADIIDFGAYSKFWDSWKGRIIRAIVINWVYTKEDILKAKGLKKEQCEIAASELSQTHLLEPKENGDARSKPLMESIISLI
jgi:hypothetical protein